MLDGHRRYRSFYLAALLVMVVSTANAAFFDVETQIGPQTATEPQAVTAGCRVDGFANGDAFVSPDGRRVFVYGNAGASIDGDACDDEASLSISASQVVGALSGEDGESVAICVRARVLQNAQADGEAFAAESDVGGGFAGPPPALPMEFLLNGNPVFTFGPSSLSDPASVSESFNDEIEVTVGDTIQVRTFASASASADSGGPHSGFASARARSEISLVIGGCDGVMAPTATPLGLSMLAACLAVLGALRAAPRLRR